ncbi:CidA/LrgA family protein [Fundidesulfovibrio terrae]|uniref:CidA/LrgA family protein n=1 Tax=Fundidesulfovibrio terrae TaxID=2922866 RepID=UPI001FAF55F1|nr:CidA/LrgA family protein [Fundidesulfovibrio terrae]
MRKLLLLAAQTALLWAIYRASTWFVAATGLPVPGNVVGVAALFALLRLGVVKLEYVQEAADFLLRHLVFFFIPITVGLMNWGGVFREHAWTLLAAILVSTLLPLWTVGFITQRIDRQGREG